MWSYDQIKNKIAELTGRNGKNSISKADVFGVMTEMVNRQQSAELTMSNLTIRKIYASVAAMNADAAAPVGDDVEKIRKGQLVAIQNAVDATEMGNVYRYTGSAWEYVSKIGDVSTKAEKSDISDNSTKYTDTSYDYTGKMLIGYYLSNGILITAGASNWRYIDFDVVQGQTIKYKGDVYGDTTKCVLGRDINNNISVLLAHGSTASYTSIAIPAGIVRVSITATITQGSYSVIGPKTKLDFSNRSIPIALDQISAIFNRIRNVELFSNYISESINSDNGVFTSSANWARTEFVSVQQGDKFLYSGITTFYNPIICFDASKQFVSGNLLSAGTYSNIEVTIPSNVSYVIAVSRNISPDTFSFKFINSTGLPWSSQIGDLIIGNPKKFELLLRTIAGVANQPYFESADGYYVVKPGTANTPPRFYLIPNSSPATVKTKFEMFYTDYSSDSSNYSALNILLLDSAIHYGCNRNGSGITLKQIFGGKYFGSSLLLGSARTEFSETEEKITHKFNKFNLTRIDSNGNTISLQNFSNNDAALAGGLVLGDIYRNGDVLMIVH